MLINLIALKKIDRSPRVAFEAALKSLSESGRLAPWEKVK
jgi:hypothetical protein